MQQTRHWRLGSLNEFRKFFKLEPHKSFESINSDPKVAEHLRRLYDRTCYTFTILAPSKMGDCVPYFTGYVQCFVTAEVN
jgi:hypothetical protein